MVVLEQADLSINYTTRVDLKRCGTVGHVNITTRRINKSTGRVSRVVLTRRDLMGMQPLLHQRHTLLI